MLLSGNLFTKDKIKLITENERTSQLILYLLKEVFGVKGNLYISEKKAGDGKISSYKLTVSAEDLWGMRFARGLRGGGQPGDDPVR